ncbi:MAG: sigma-54-dependent Fis family transcriptional regulator [Gammaproteobacteria bacterium RBG_16_51_14]|nr:MAG: sigma-54-dependent Fis family transcriptional regulator [Gammaproteobacteria bacterium RBG_16_51_14]
MQSRNIKQALIIDDEPDILELLAITLQRMEVDSICTGTLAGARKLLKNRHFDICLTDMRLPDGDGVHFVSYLQKNYPSLPVAVITAHGNMESAIQALKSGAFDFLTKPVDLNLLRTVVKGALRLTGEKFHTERQLIGESEAISNTRATIVKLARSQAPVYISGESGTGKELVARMIHEQGPRSDRAFVPVNCGAIPAELMESEFFGHVKGSFTGASLDKDGLFQAAQGGTLFLDEIAELPQHMQVKLLRTIQEKSIRPVGATGEISVDVRILSATHKDLATLVKEAAFRQDLFYRINVIELQVPPLRERAGDIPLLVSYILERFARESGDRHIQLAKDALSALMHYRFPGNVRELENILERAMTLCEGDVVAVADLKLPDLREAGSLTGEGKALDSYLDDVEKQTILKALEETRWNKTAAARMLGISFRALRYRLEKLGLD